MNEKNNANSWSLIEQALKEATEIKTPELTIDLPHNQKLTIGQLKPNTIVEIATWRGTGAPDENSVRMLIGASLQNGEEMAAENSKIEDVIEAMEAEEVVEPPVDNRPMWSWPTTEETVVEKSSAPALGGPSTPTAWELVQKMEQERAQAKQTEFQKEMGRKQMRKSTSKKSLNFRLLSIFGPLVSIALIIGGLNISGILAFDHPQVGPELPFGSATSSLVAIVPNAEPAAGEFAMATIEGERNLVRVEALSGSDFVVSTMAGQKVLTGAELDGKMSFLIPFVGYLWTVVGQ
jgi:hypothetical protein